MIRQPPRFKRSHTTCTSTHLVRSNRFNSGDRCSWYCAYDLQTSAEEVAFHRARELGYIGIYEDDARYVELLADFIGDFPDLDGQARHPALAPDPAVGYPAGQALAVALRGDGHRGLLYPSVRSEEHTSELQSLMR